MRFFFIFISHFYTFNYIVFVFFVNGISSMALHGQDIDIS
jgi:hypothetical protein